MAIYRSLVIGFTLIECLITLCLLGILCGLSYPSMHTLWENTQLRQDARQLTHSLALAQSEAVRRQRPVVICGSMDDKTCGPSWDQGWLVVEVAGTGAKITDQKDSVSLLAPPPVLLHYRRHQPHGTVEVNVFGPHHADKEIRFSPLGHSAQHGTFRFFRRGGAFVEVVVSPGGRVRMQ